MICLENISKTFYSAFGEPKKVFQGLNLEIQEEDFISVIGSNGAGKSTLLDCITGNVSLYEG